MNYQYVYDCLIQRRQLEPASGYTENHHITMRSMGGEDAPENLVKLTGREHWIAHQLLFKIYRNSQTAHACHMMAMRCEERGIPQIRNSYMYEAARKVCIKNWKASGKKRSGKANGSYGTMWISNIDLRRTKKISKNDPIPEGWILGRDKWKSIIKRKLTDENRKKLKEEKSHNKKKEIQRIWKQYILSDCRSVNSFSKKYGYDQKFLSNNFRKYINEYKTERRVIFNKCSVADMM